MKQQLGEEGDERAEDENHEEEAEEEDLQPRKMMKFIHTAKNQGYPAYEYEDPFAYVFRRYAERMR